jgi:hypothetical protein
VKKDSYKRSFCLIISLAALLCLVSCSAILSGLPSPVERKSIAEGEKSLVILRLSADLEGKPMSSALNFWDGGFRLEAAEMDTGEVPKTIIPVAPSLQAGKEGWAYFILSPGNYYLYVIPPGHMQSPSSVTADGPGRYYRWVKREKIPIPAYWFSIPKGKPVIYLGSLSVSCKKGGVFGQLCEEPSEICISDETEAARVASGAYFDFSETVWTESLFDYGKSNAGNLMGQSATLGIFVPGVYRKIVPEWRKRALYQAIGWGAPMLALEGGYLPGGIATFYILYYVPPATLFGLIKGEYDVYNWEPCSRALLDELNKCDPAGTLKKALVDLLPLYDVSRVVEILYPDKAPPEGLTGNANFFLEANIMRIGLSECTKEGLFSIDSSIRFLLKDASGGKVLLDRTLLYAGKYSDKAYELWLSPASPCRKIEEYCGEGGINVLKLELQKAFESAINDFFRKDQ